MTRIVVPLHFWGTEIVLKSEKVYKCYVQDCGSKNWRGLKKRRRSKIGIG